MDDVEEIVRATLGEPMWVGVDYGNEDTTAYVSVIRLGTPKAPPAKALQRHELKAWASRKLPRGKFRWLEIERGYTGGGMEVVAVIYRDHSYPGAKKYSYHWAIDKLIYGRQWRKTVARQLMKFRREARKGLEDWMDAN